MKNPFENAKIQLERANNILHFKSELIVKLMHPDREVRISIPIIMDDGKQKIFEGYRVQYNNARGPYKGGIRYHKDLLPLIFQAPDD